MGTETTFESSKLRERDKIIEQKHQSELRGFQQRIDKLKDRNNDLCSQLYDIRNRTSRLASSLGFHDLTEAEVAIDAAEGDVRYKECLERNERLEKAFREATEDRNESQMKVKVLEVENHALQTDLEKNAASKNLISMELTALQGKYDALVEKEKKASERRRKDYDQWEKFRKWIFCEAEFKEGLSNREQLQQFVWLVAQKKYKLACLGRFVDDEELFKLVDQDMMKENYPTPKPAANLAALPTPSSTTKCTMPTSPLATSSKTNQLSSTSMNLNPIDSQLRRDGLTRTFAIKPPNSSDTEDDPPVSTSLPAVGDEMRPNAGNSSETEEDSQSQIRWLSSQALAKKTCTIPSSSQSSSQTEDESQTQIKWLQAPLPTMISAPPSSFTPARVNMSISFNPVSMSTPLPISKDPVPARAAVDLSIIGDSPTRRRVSDTAAYSQRIQSSPEFGEEPARKFRRVSEGHSPVSSTRDRGRGRYRKSNSATARDRGRAASASASRFARKDTQSQSLKRGRSKVREDDKENEGGLDVEGNNVTLRRVDVKGKGKEMLADVNTPTPKGPAQKMLRLDDYSAYKGRGRYARNVSTSKGDKTLNELYAINPDRNNGLSHQYDEVVRGKEQRKRMDAGVCEECRDYYEAIGTLPPRLQQPLWKSPTKTSKAQPRTCQHGKKHAHLKVKDMSSSRPKDSLPDEDFEFDDLDVGSSFNRTSIDSHRQAISRHRHNWARGNTPPGYWDIGFPSTQDAENINEKAREMERKKMEAVEREAMRDGGRYRRR